MYYRTNTRRRKLVDLLKNPVAIALLGFFLIIVAFLAVIYSFAEEKSISEKLTKEQNERLLREITEEIRKLNGNLHDYNGIDEDLILTYPWVIAYYKYLVLSSNMGLLEKKDLEEVMKEATKRGIKNVTEDVVRKLLPEVYFRKCKNELLSIARRMQPRFFYIKHNITTETTKQVTKQKTRTYTYTVENEVYDPQTGQTEKVSSIKTQTVKITWAEKVKVTETQPIFLLICADTIKNRFTVSYKLQKTTTTYQNDLPVSASVYDAGKLELDFDPKKIIEQKEAKKAKDLNIKTKYEIVSNLDNTGKVKKTVKTDVLDPGNQNPSVSLPKEAKNVSYTDSQEVVLKEETLQKVQTMPVIDSTYNVDAEYKRLDEMILEDNKNDDVEFSKKLIIYTAMTYERGDKDFGWLFEDVKENIFGRPEVVSVSSLIQYVPREYEKYFEEAEKILGIPSWFLAAIAARESSFNPKAKAKNKDGYACGLMQVQQIYWDDHVKDFKARYPNIDITGDINNPRDQILIGSFVFKSYLGGAQIDWAGSGWQEGVIPALASYWLGPEGCKSDAPDYKKTRTYYAPKLIAQARLFKFRSFEKQHPEYMPVDSKYMIITSLFGLRIHPITGREKMHTGVDIGAPVNTDVKSIIDGIVEFTGAMQGYGNTVIVKGTLSGQEIEVLYAHLNSIVVEKGQAVTQGQVVGGVGSTGWSTGPHLHFEIRIAGQPVDPFEILQ
ncbi:Peptidase M23 [Caldicellulosiruptor kronotskyensis 2002]|uniref:Peptidase M23 n=1 Tax=Caldicellulosiruptor kronotskyensis (strain DSM 18902 / VKM B-2412 / 2002) TaxID=632348 RepID=E4SET9_CALK2|nr:M23 family metallopeptidase [Caldicellulosiruptor kronotskyensis]ADQ45576.1 Peptidase M23 [Caldicellulosiruptor kronotskyensis 2002]